MAALIAKRPVITFVTDAIIERRLYGIYKKIMYRDFTDAKSLVNNTIYTLTYAQTESPRTSSAAIGVLYRVLVDLAMKRYDDAHSKVRDLYYTIEEPYMQDRYTLEDIIDA